MEEILVELDSNGMEDEALEDMTEELDCVFTVEETSEEALEESLEGDGTIETEEETLKELEATQLEELGLAWEDDELFKGIFEEITEDEGPLDELEVTNFADVIFEDDLEELGTICLEEDALEDFGMEDEETL